MLERIFPLFSQAISLVALGVFCYAFATPAWFQGTTPRFSGEVTVGLWYVCQETSQGNSIQIDDSVRSWGSWVCQAWAFPPTSLEVVQAVASLCILTSFLANIFLLPHTYRSIVIIFLGPDRTYTTIEERDHSHQLAYAGSSMLLFSSVGGIACLSMFVNFSRYYLASRSTQYGFCVFLWCIGWILALIGAIVGAHSIDDFEEYGEYTREEIRQRYMEHYFGESTNDDFEWWNNNITGDEGEEQQQGGEGEEERRGGEEGEEEFFVESDEGCCCC